MIVMSPEGRLERILMFKLLRAGLCVQLQVTRVDNLLTVNLAVFKHHELLNDGDLMVNPRVVLSFIFKDYV